MTNDFNAESSFGSWARHWEKYAAANPDPEAVGQFPVLGIFTKFYAL